MRLSTPVTAVRRLPGGVEVRDQTGGAEVFDHVIMATHADEGLKLLVEPSVDEQRWLGAFGYSRNRVVLHGDATLMPKRTGVWSAWNYVGRGAADNRAGAPLCVTYWMNRLQDLPGTQNHFVTLNPGIDPKPSLVVRTEVFHHPIFDTAALAAQPRLWSLQGHGGVWWCGAYFGSGFHEDGVQSGLAVAEAIGGVRRPWSVRAESGRMPGLLAA